MADFKKSIVKVFKYEGGYSNHKNDGGGETKYGISSRAYPTLDIKNLTIVDAENIYKRDYWNKLYLDNEQNQDYADQVLLFGVNAGIRRAKDFDKIATISAKNETGAIHKRLQLELFRTSVITYYVNLCNKNPKYRPFLSLIFYHYIVV